MEASCSFKFIVGGACSYDRQDKSKLFEVVPLVSCNKDVQGHKSAWCFAGVKNESELNLARAGIFYMSAKDINALTICPFHRSELGTGWRRSQNTCRIPDEIRYGFHEPYCKKDYCCVIYVLYVFRYWSF